MFSSQFGLPQCTTSSGCLLVLNKAGTATSLRRRRRLACGGASLQSRRCTASAPGAHRADRGQLELDLRPHRRRRHRGRRRCRRGLDLIHRRRDVQRLLSAPHYATGVVDRGGDRRSRLRLLARFPSLSASVVAVGATHLNLHSDGSYGGGSAWSSAGSRLQLLLPGAAMADLVDGCRRMRRRPSRRRRRGGGRRSGHRRRRSTSTPVPSQEGRGGGYQIGGTSLAAPLIAGVFALAGGTPPGVSPGPRSTRIAAGCTTSPAVPTDSAPESRSVRPVPATTAPPGSVHRTDSRPSRHPAPRPAALTRAIQTCPSPRLRFASDPPATLPLSVLNDNGVAVTGSVSLASAARLRYPTPTPGPRSSASAPSASASAPTDASS